MKMSRRFLQRLPIFASAGFLAIMFLVNLWNFAIWSDFPKLRIRSAEPLWGVTRPPLPAWTLDAFIAGENQKAFSSALGQYQPIFPISVRVKNQFLYSVFGVSGAQGVVVGRGRQLFENLYIEEFCARGLPPEPAMVEAWASRLRAIQAAVEAKGKSFLYLISPSKAARESRYLPAGVACPALVNGAGEKLAPYRAALEAHGVAYVDAASLMTASAPDYPIDLFPRSGIHWNYLGAALAARQMTRALNAHGASPLPAYDFDWTPLDEASGTDMDLLQMLNLLWPDRHYPTAAIQGRSAGACEKTPKLFAVGGSFLIEVLVNLMETQCPTAVDFWHYIRYRPGDFTRWRTLAERREDLGRHTEPSLETSAEFGKGLAGADVVILEENESVIAQMRQVDDMFAAASK